LKNIRNKAVAVLLCFSMILVMVVSVTGQGLYWKPEYPDYAPSGMPDFDQKQDGWYYQPTGQWVFCGPVAVANSLWWFDSKFEPGATPPSTVSDGFGLVTPYSFWDDHDPNNVQPLVNELAGYMQITPAGTEVHAMKQGIDQYLTAKGMHAYFYTRLFKQPTFQDVETEVERCQDVVLLLGFWQYDPGMGMWYRTGGHYITVAGIDSSTTQVAFSDPYLDAAEPPPHGIGSPGRVLPPGLMHFHSPFPPDTLHNNASYVSQDIWAAAGGSPSPGGLWGFPDYNQYYLPPDFFYNFDKQNFPVEYQSRYGHFNPSLFVYTEVEYAVVTCPWFAKGQYSDYAPSGMPDFDQKQDGWTNPWPPNPGSWSFCGPTAVANSLWWYDSKFEPNPIPPPTINDGFPLVQSYNPGVWDDHDSQNVQPFIMDVAWYMDTDGRRTGLPHCGTDVFDMQAGIAQYMSDKGVNPQGDCNGDGVVDNTDANIVAAAMGSVPGSPNWDLRADVVHDNVINIKDAILVGNNFGQKWGKFYEKTAAMPTYDYLAHQIKMCEDVVLLLGLWQEVGPGYFIKIGGHFVTAHGVDTNATTIAISDPFQDNAEHGGQGRVIPLPPHPHPPVPPDTVHNDAMYVSHDYYTVGPSPSPGGIFGLTDYNWSTIINNVYGQNIPRNDTRPIDPWMGMPVYVEIEYAVVVSCRGPMVVAGSDDGNVYALDYMGNLLWSYNTGAQVVSVAMSERGEYVVAGSFMRGLYVFDTAGTLLWSKPIQIFESYGQSWRGADSKTVGISADGSYVVAAAADGVYLYDNLGNQIWHYNDGWESFVEISPDGRYIVSCCYGNGKVRFFSHLRDGFAGWQAADGSPIWIKQKSNSAMFFNWAAIDGCGRHVAFSADADSDSFQEVYLFDRNGTEIWSWEFTKLGFVRIDMPWDGRSVVAVNDDPSDSTGTNLVYFGDMKNGVQGWQAGDGTPQWIYVPPPAGLGNDLYSVAISPSGKVIATGPAANNIHLVSNSGAPLQTIADGLVNALDLTFTGEYGVEGDRVEPALTGTIRFFTKTRNSVLWSFATAGKINSVAIQKKYPCLEPFPKHDVDITSITRVTSLEGKVKTYVCYGYPANAINITLSNHGDFDETVEVTLYAYSSSNNTMIVVGNETVTILKGTNPVVSITWTSTKVPYYGNYTLHATIGPVQDENNLTDNEFVDSGLMITGVGDINGDRKVDVKDVYAVGKCFGTTIDGPNPPGRVYDPNCDINCDYKIDTKDYYIPCKWYGTVYP